MIPSSIMAITRSFSWRWEPPAPLDIAHWGTTSRTVGLREGEIGHRQRGANQACRSLDGILGVFRSLGFGTHVTRSAEASLARLHRP
jgi:hypothetical protein